MGFSIKYNFLEQSIGILANMYSSAGQFSRPSGMGGKWELGMTIIQTNIHQGHCIVAISDFIMVKI